MSQDLITKISTLRDDMNNAMKITVGKSNVDINNIANTITSKQKTEYFAELAAYPVVREWLDEREVQDILENNFSDTAADFESTIKVNRNDVADDQTGQYVLKAKSITSAMMNHKRKIVMKLYANGFETSSKLGSIFRSAKNISTYESKAMFANNHIIGGSGSQSNYSTMEFNAENYDNAIEAAAAWYYGTDTSDLIEPNFDMIMFGRGIRRDVLEMFKTSTLLAATGALTRQSAENTLEGEITKLVYNPYLGANDWILIDTSKEILPVFFVLREAPMFEELSKSESEFMRKYIYYGISARYNVAFTHWFLAYGNFPSRA